MGSEDSPSHGLLSPEQVEEGDASLLRGADCDWPRSFQADYMIFQDFTRYYNTHTLPLYYIYSTTLISATSSWLFHQRAYLHYIPSTCNGTSHLLQTSATNHDQNKTPSVRLSFLLLFYPKDDRSNANHWAKLNPTESTQPTCNAYWLRNRCTMYRSLALSHRFHSTCCS